MIIRNGLVLTDSGVFVRGDLVIDENHRIAAVPGVEASAAVSVAESSATVPGAGTSPGTAAFLPADEETIDAQGLYVLPGLVDVHIHGAVGHDFCDASPQGLARIAAYLHSNGITSFCPTSMTLPPADLKEIFRSIQGVPADSAHARILGIHMEGPFIAPEKKGAQNASHIHAPDIALFRELNEACGGQIRLITIAPEQPGSMEFIEALHDTTAISLGHSPAGYEEAKKAFDAGACHATHLFNAMASLHHRDPGIIGAAADSPQVMVEVICDGIHVHPAVIRMIFGLFGPDRVVLISDAMRAAGMEDGSYELGGQEVHKCGSRATLADGTLAGSVTNLFGCMQNAVRFGIPLETAVRAASCNPAKSIGLADAGRIIPGGEADLLLVDSNLELVKVL